MGFKYAIEESRNSKLGFTTVDNLNIEQITLGAVLRIANATEAMAKNYTDLINENQRLKNRLKSVSENYEVEKRRTAKYKGLWNSLKRNNKILTAPSAAEN